MKIFDAKYPITCHFFHQRMTRFAHSSRVAGEFEVGVVT